MTLAFQFVPLNHGHIVSYICCGDVWHIVRHVSTIILSHHAPVDTRIILISYPGGRYTFMRCASLGTADLVLTVVILSRVVGLVGRHVGEFLYCLEVLDNNPNSEISVS